MKRVAILVGAMSCCALAACSPPGSDDEAAAGKTTGDPNLKCAAMISAASYLVAGGKAEQDAAMTKRGLVSLMTFLNTYAIPKGLKEPEAFAELKSQRETLMETLSTDDIMAHAKLCIARSPL